VQVEVGNQRLLRDEVRVINRVSGSCWEADANEAAERLSQRLSRQPYRIAHALERTKQRTQLIIYHLEGLADAVRCKNALDDTQRGLLFDLMGVPLPLRDGTRRVPAAGDGPGLADLIARELARHQANLVNTLNKRDREEQLNAMNCPSSYAEPAEERPSAPTRTLPEFPDGCSEEDKQVLRIFAEKLDRPRRWRPFSGAEGALGRGVRGRRIVVTCNVTRTLTFGGPFRERIRGQDAVRTAPTHRTGKPFRVSGREGGQKRTGILSGTG